MRRTGCGRRRLGAGCAIVALSLPAAVRAAEPLRDFDIPEQPREEALLALSAQAGISLGFAQNVHCPGRAGVRGRMGLSEALDRLLGGSACVARRGLVAWQWSCNAACEIASIITSVTPISRRPDGIPMRLFSASII